MFAALMPYRLKYFVSKFPGRFLSDGAWKLSIVVHLIQTIHNKMINLEPIFSKRVYLIFNAAIRLMRWCIIALCAFFSLYNNAVRISVKSVY